MVTSDMTYILVSLSIGFVGTLSGVALGGAIVILSISRIETFVREALKERYQDKEKR